MSPIVVSGFQSCGAATLTGMLAAGGMALAGGAHEPSYELNAATPTPAAILDDLFSSFPPFVANAMRQMIGQQLRGPGCDGTRHINAAWWASIGGAVVKVAHPHLLTIPRGPFKTLWCDPADERRRAITVLAFGDSNGGANVPPGLVDLMQHHFIERRAVARTALERAGATIMNVGQADLTSGRERCRAICEKIAAFLKVPLDIDAMVARASSIAKGSIDGGVLLDGPEAIVKTHAMLDAQPLGTRVVFLPPR